MLGKPTTDARIEASLPKISEARKFTAERLDELRRTAAEKIGGFPVLIGTNGSYARREASNESDLDFFAVCEDAAQVAEAQRRLDGVAVDLLRIAGRKPSPDGSFGRAHDLHGMLSNIGGDNDTNDAITRRVLFLLEGEWLHGEAIAERVRRNLLDCYIRPSISSHQLSLFLLNDIIRYYRTICVDFEFKTMQSSKPKPWGTRNIKLVFSRKLLYFSGVLTVAESAQRTYEEKLKRLNKLFSMPVIDRIFSICGDRCIRALDIYEEFLSEMSKPEVRAILDKVSEATRNDSEVFRTLKDRGHHFSWELLSLLKHTYDASHPIHKALVL